jgi:hypothetical protein
MSLVAEMIPMTRNGCNSSRATMVRTSSRMTTMNSVLLTVIDRA